MNICPRCKLIHVGCLIGFPGEMVLFLSDWEEVVTESDLQFQLHNQIPLFKIPIPTNLIRFEGMPTDF